MLGQCRRRWTNIKPALADCLVFAGFLVSVLEVMIETLPQELKVATQCIAQIIPYLMTLYKYKRFYHYIYKSFFGDELFIIISILMFFSYHSDLLLYCLTFNVAM